MPLASFFPHGEKALLPVSNHEFVALIVLDGEVAAAQG
jgi:hypothetical protein